MESCVDVVSSGHRVCCGIYTNKLYLQTTMPSCHNVTNLVHEFLPIVRQGLLIATFPFTHAFMYPFCPSSFDHSLYMPKHTIDIPSQHTIDRP